MNEEIGRHVAALLGWTAIESPSHDPAAVNRMMGLAADEAADVGIEVERVPGRDGLGDSVVMRAGPSLREPGILVLSHLDTVHPVGTLGELPVRIEGDRLTAQTD